MACDLKSSSVGDSEKHATVYVHLPSGVDPMTVADHLVAVKLAASVSIIPAVSRVRASSTRGSKVETETLLIINSKRERVNDMTKYFKEVLPRYATMLNIICVPLETGNPLFLKWVQEATRN